MYNTFVAFYVYGVACLVGGFVSGVIWEAYKND